MMEDYKDDHDIDVFFRDAEQHAALAPRFREIENAVMEKASNPLGVVCVDNWLMGATGLARPRNEGDPPLQLITKREFASAEALLDDFDFTVVQLVSDGQTIRMTDACDRDIRDRKLRMVHGSSDIRATHRIARYFLYGFEPDDEVLALAENLDVRNYYDPTGARFSCFDNILAAFPTMDHTSNSTLSKIGDLVFDRHEDGMIAYVAGMPLPANMAFIYLFCSMAREFVRARMLPVWAACGMENTLKDPSMTAKTFFDAYRAAL
jgi:hypothetical protein